jgi:hypothetical protein
MSGGAISSEGDFNFSACYTHNYREFMGGFTDWVEQVADSRSARDYRQRVSDAESASIWQSPSGRQAPSPLSSADGICLCPLVLPTIAAHALIDPFTT